MEMRKGVSLKSGLNAISIIMTDKDLESVYHNQACASGPALAPFSHFNN